MVEQFEQFLQEVYDFLPNATTMSIEDFLKQELGAEALQKEAEGSTFDFSDKIQQPNTDNNDAMKFVKDRASGGKFSMKQDMPIVHKNNIVDENGNLLDPAELKKMFTERPSELLAQNEKMKHSGGGIREFWDISLPAYIGLYYDEKEDKLKVIKICTSAGSCKLWCYARKGGYVQFEKSSLRATRIVTYLKNDPQGFKNQLISELKSKQAKVAGKKEIALRWHDSGDFIDSIYLKLAFEVAKATPEVTHYAYTKRVKLLSSAQIPDNFIIQYSFGGVEDKTVNVKSDRYSKVVPRQLFKGLVKKTTDNKWDFVDDASKLELKQRIANEYQLPLDTVITYEELMNMPYDKNTEIKNKYNVIVKGGDGDDAAARKEVQGIFLLEH